MPFAGARLRPFMRIEIIAVSPMNLCGNNDIMRGFTVEMLKRARGSVIKRLEEANYDLNNDKGLARGLAGASVGAGVGWRGEDALRRKRPCWRQWVIWLFCPVMTAVFH